MTNIRIAAASLLSILFLGCKEAQPRIIDIKEKRGIVRAALAYGSDSVNYLVLGTLEPHHRNGAEDSTRLIIHNLDSGAEKLIDLNRAAEIRQLGQSPGGRLIVGTSLPTGLFTAEGKQLFAGYDRALFLHGLSITDNTAALIQSGPDWPEGETRRVEIVDIEIGKTKTLPIPDTIRGPWFGVEALFRDGTVWFYSAYPIRRWKISSRGEVSRRNGRNHKYIVDGWEVVGRDTAWQESDSLGGTKWYLRTGAASTEQAYLSGAKSLDPTHKQLPGRPRLLYKEEMIYTLNGNGRLHPIFSLKGFHFTNITSGRDLDVPVVLTDSTGTRWQVSGILADTTMVLHEMSGRRYIIRGSNRFSADSVRANNIRSLSISAITRSSNTKHLIYAHLYSHSRIGITSGSDKINIELTPGEDGQVDQLETSSDGYLAAVSYPDATITVLDSTFRKICAITPDIALGQMRALRTHRAQSGELIILTQSDYTEDRTNAIFIVKPRKCQLKQLEIPLLAEITDVIQISPRKLLLTARIEKEQKVWSWDISRNVLSHLPLESSKNPGALANLSLMHSLIADGNKINVVSRLDGGLTQRTSLPFQVFALREAAPDTVLAFGAQGIALLTSNGSGMRQQIVWHMNGISCFLQRLKAEPTCPLTRSRHWTPVTMQGTEIIVARENKILSWPIPTEHK